jgi:hypothetical protein
MLAAQSLGAARSIELLARRGLVLCAIDFGVLDVPVAHGISNVLDAAAGF